MDFKIFVGLRQVVLLQAIVVQDALDLSLRKINKMIKRRLNSLRLIIALKVQQILQYNNWFFLFSKMHNSYVEAVYLYAAG